MEENKLTYEEWCLLYPTHVGEDVIDDFKVLHNVDILYEIECIRRVEYNRYIAATKDN
jgi:hypothetical protein